MVLDYLYRFLIVAFHDLAQFEKRRSLIFLLKLSPNMILKPNTLWKLIQQTQNWNKWFRGCQCHACHGEGQGQSQMFDYLRTKNMVYQFYGVREMILTANMKT